MSKVAESPSNPVSRSTIKFDLEDELTPEQVAKFKESAKEAGVDVKQHFLNLTLREVPKGPEAA